MSAGLEVRDLVVRYGSHVVVDRASISVAPGRVVGLVGESGSGKSSIARAIVGLAPIREGTITVDGSELHTLRARERARRVQMVFQDPYGSLNPRMTIRDIIVEGLETRPGLQGAAMDREVASLLDQVALSSDVMSRMPRRLSGGQRQRVAIARALAAQPSILIADEITSALDVSVQAQVLNVLRGVLSTQRLGLLFISHNLAVVRYICDDVSVMRHGIIVEAGTVDEVMEHPQHPYTRELLAAVPAMRS